MGKRRKKKQRNETEYPLGTVALYGPDEETAVKIVAAVFEEGNDEPIALERWVSNDLPRNERISRELQQFFKTHRVKSTIVTDRPMGCVHEEGIDYPEGEDCPFCPFWKGKQ